MATLQAFQNELDDVEAEEIDILDFPDGDNPGLLLAHLGKGPAVAQQAQALLPVDDDGPAARGITRRVGQRLRDAVADHQVSAEGQGCERAHVASGCLRP